MAKSAMDLYNMDIECHDWSEVYSAQSAHTKAATVQSEHASIVGKCFPLKVVKVSSDDCPWWNPQLQDLHRRKQRAFRKDRNSAKWNHMDKKFQRMKKMAKNNFYKKMVNYLVKKDQNQWYSQYKRLTNMGKSAKVVVDEINHLSDQEQAEHIANHITAVSQEYTHLKSEDIKISNFSASSIPHIPVNEVEEKLLEIKPKNQLHLGMCQPNSSSLQLNT